MFVLALKIRYLNRGLSVNLRGESRHHNVTRNRVPHTHPEFEQLSSSQA